MSEKYIVERGGSGHEWYVSEGSTIENGRQRYISCSEYEHQAEEIVKKLNAYPKLVEAIKILREDLQKQLDRNQSIIGCTALRISLALLTELKEM